MEIAQGALQSMLFCLSCCAQEIETLRNHSATGKSVVMFEPLFVPSDLEQALRKWSAEHYWDGGNLISVFHFSLLEFASRGDGQPVVT